MKKTSRLVSNDLFEFGGGTPIKVQTMLSEPIESINDALLQDIGELTASGCDIIRISAPTMEAAKTISDLQKRVSVPLVADVHFRPDVALWCIENGIRKIRINPGNIAKPGDISGQKKVIDIIHAARDNDVILRVGVNGGSLPIDKRGEADISQTMADVALGYLDFFEKEGFFKSVVSLKNTNWRVMVRANLLFREKSDYPLHLGVTEAGTMIPALTKTTLAFAELLPKGIGDTVRVSITDRPLQEVLAGQQILLQLGLNSHIITRLVSCPQCGRADFQTQEFAKKVEKTINTLGKDVTVAIMGCVVNGPEEAKHADLGIAGYKNKAVIFKKGAIYRQVEKVDAVEEFIKELKKL